MQIDKIFKDKNFAPFFWTQFLGAFNDNFFKNALVVLVTFRGIELMGLNAANLVAIAGALFVLPFVLFSPIAGQLCDKYEKAQVVRLTKILEIVIMSLAALGFLLHSYGLLLLLLFLMGTQSTFFGPAKFAIIPDLVKTGGVLEANALVEFGTFLSILLGTIGGGLITSVPQADLWIGLGIIFFAALGYLTSRGVPSTPIGDPKIKIQMNPFPEFINLWKLAAEKRILLTTILAISWFWFFGAGVLSVLPIYVKNQLGGGEAMVTLFLAMFTLGVGAGSLLCEKLSGGQVKLVLVPVGALGLSLFLFDLFLVGIPWGEGMSASISTITGLVSGWRLMIDFFMMSVSGGLFIVPLYTLLQTRSDLNKRSRVVAANNVLSALFMVLSSVLVLVLYQLQLSPIQVFATFSGLNLAAILVLIFVEPELNPFTQNETQ